MITPREVLRKAKGLPTLPTAVARLAALLDDETAGAADFEKIVKPDPALTANLLRLANSAFFGARRQITSVRQAIALMGVRRVFELAASASFSRVLPNRIPGYEIDAKGFWRHSVAVAVLAEHLVKRAGRRPPEMTFTAGLLHDIGKLAIGSVLVEESEEILSRMWGSDVSFVQAEKNVIGTDHTEVGDVMAEEWNLPLAVSWAIRWHHDPGGAPDEADRLLVDLIHISDVVSQSLGFGADVGGLARTVDEASVKRVGLSVQEVETVAGEAIDQIKEMDALLSGERK